MKKMRMVAVAAVSLTFAGFAQAAALVNNGSFELASGGTSYNMANSTFTAYMPSATAFGAANELDIVTGSGYGPAPYDGAVKVALHTKKPSYGGTQDAFSLSLGAPITAGSSYNLSFAAATLIESWGSYIGGVEIGLSSSATSFGTSIFTATPTTTSWATYNHTFTAGTGANYLTVRSLGGAEYYTFVDSFAINATTAINPVPEPETYAMMLAGLGLLGMMAHRRKRQ